MHNNFSLYLSIHLDNIAEIELEGSPEQLVFQCPGVIYAVNCGGPAYHALNDIVYTSEFSQFANFTREFNHGEFTGDLCVMTTKYPEKYSRIIQEDLL